MISQPEVFNSKLTKICFSLASICGADCIFCPSNRGKRIKEKIMSFDIVKRVIDEITSNKFKKYHNIECISLGENGDAFLNKDIIKIARYIKNKLPNIHVEIYTNFQNFDKNKIKIVLENNLIDSFNCNIDGSTPDKYYRIKKLKLKNTMSNLRYFIQTRKDLNIEVPLIIYIVTLHNYIYSIFINLGFYPLRMKDNDLNKLQDDFFIIKRQLRDILNLKTDEMLRPPVIGWTEREQIDINNLDYNKFSCNMLNRINHQAFIAPDGTWYACCWDANNELVLGNVTKQSLHEIYFGNKRRRLIKLLLTKQFKKIGSPCNTVNCCQNLYSDGINR